MPSDDAKGVENTENDDAKCVLGMEPFVMQPDGEGQDIAYTLIDGMHFLNVPWIKQRLAALPDLPIQDKDVLIPAFPKSGTHWMWEICTMIRRMKAAPTNGGKMEGFIEFIPQEALADYASPRMINTHLLPERLPKQILEKKTKLIMMLRNPKDVAVSFYHHTKSIPPYGYSNGTFKGYFEVFINGNNDFGSWFDYTLAWDKFLQTYPKDRQLVLYYEDVKEDLLKYVKVIARFFNVDLDDTLADAIADQCGFKKMKETMNPFGQLGPLGMAPGMLQGMLRGMPPGMAQGMLRGMPPGMPPGMSPGMPRGMPPVMGQGMPRGMPPGPPQGMPPGMPPGMPQGMPPSMHPDMSNGMPPGMPEGAEKMIMPNMLRKDKFMKENPEEMKPDIWETDGEGQQITYQMIEGTRMGCFPGLRQRFAELPDVKIRDDDVLISAFPKSGTHWMWEVCTMILRRKAAPSNSTKIEGFIEFIPPWLLDSYASPRVINTHVLPESMPKQILEKKTKLIVMLRNPKDVTVSFYHHTKGIPHYGYKNGTFKGYFEVFLNGKNDYGSWFEYTLAWDKFLQTYPKDRQLILYYEDVKENLPTYVSLIAKYLNVEIDDALADAIADECGFKKMKEANVKMAKQFIPVEMPASMAQDGKKMEIPVLLRKGEVADWKTNFTVAQNERFDAKIKANMGECSFKFRYEL